MLFNWDGPHLENLLECILLPLRKTEFILFFFYELAII